jgi:hypothetical protein
MEPKIKSRKHYEKYTTVSAALYADKLKHGLKIEYILKYSLEKNETYVTVFPKYNSSSYIEFEIFEPGENEGNHTYCSLCDSLLALLCSGDEKGLIKLKKLTERLRR